MVAGIDAHREAYGVEPICAVLPIAPSRYYAVKAGARNPECQPARTHRDARLGAHIDRVWREHREVYGCARSGNNCTAKGTPSPAARSRG